MSEVLQPGVQIKPVLSVEEAKNLAEQVFGICVAKIKELDAYDDKNYYIEVNFFAFMSKICSMVSFLKGAARSNQGGRMAPWLRF